MRAILFTILLSCTVSAQNIDGFLGVKFGASVQTVKKSIKLSKPKAVLDTKNSDEKILVYDNITFAGRDTEFVMFKFVDDKFYKSYVYLTTELESQTVREYKTIKKELNEKYFVSVDDYENYKYPYEKNDGHTETAIKLGKATFMTFWVFEKDSAQENTISLAINEKFYIKLCYENTHLTNQAISKSKAKNYSDY